MYPQYNHTPLNNDRRYEALLNRVGQLEREVAALRAQNMTYGSKLHPGQPSTALKLDFPLPYTAVV